MGERTKAIRANRPRQRGEVTTRSQSIRNQCAHCRGWEADGHGSVAGAIKACPNTRCELYGWRTGGRETPDVLPAQGHIRAFCVMCQGGGDNRGTWTAISDCTDHGCWLWPYRKGALDRGGLAGEVAGE